MGLGSAEQLGKFIASVANAQTDLKETVVGDEIEQSLLLTPIDTVRLETTVTVTKRAYSSTAFILDHPVYGYINSATLHLDGDYASSTGVLHDTYTG